MAALLQVPADGTVVPVAASRSQVCAAEVCYALLVGVQVGSVQPTIISGVGVGEAFAAQPPAPLPAAVTVP